MTSVASTQFSHCIQEAPQTKSTWKSLFQENTTYRQGNLDEYEYNEYTFLAANIIFKNYFQPFKYIKTIFSFQGLPAQSGSGIWSTGRKMQWWPILSIYSGLSHPEGPPFPNRVTLLCAVTMKPVLKNQNPNYQRLPEVWGVQVLPLPGCSPIPHLPLMGGHPVTAKISPFSAHQCPIKKYGDGILEEVDGFTPQLAKGSTQQPSTPGTVPCPQLGDLRDSIQPGSPGSLSLPPSFRNANSPKGWLATRGCRESKNVVQDEDYVH